MKDLKGLLLRQLAETGDAERQLTKALPRLSEAADTPELRQALDKHSRQTWEHVQRLEHVFELLDSSPQAGHSSGMASLIHDALDWARSDSEKALRDAGLIMAAQRIEHYELATYGSLQAWADLLGNDDAVLLFEQTTDEEREMDDTLTEIAGRLNLGVPPTVGQYDLAPPKLPAPRKRPGKSGRAAAGPRRGK